MKKLAALLIVFTIGFTGFSQEDKNNAMSNIQEFTPSKLLKNGQWDIKFFNSLYTQTAQTNGESKSEKIARQNFFTNTTELYRGVSKKSRINLGLIVQARSNNFGGQNALSIFNFDNNLTSSRSGVTTIAPSIRIQPFASMPNFSFTSSVYLPLFKDEGFSGEFNDPAYLDKRSVFWETKFFYDKTFCDGDWQVFTEADLGFNFGEKRKDADFNNSNVGERFANNSLFVPLSAFLSYFPSAKSTLFVNAQQAFLIGYANLDTSNNTFSQNSTAFGFGGKYQLTTILNIEASFNKIVRGYNFQGLGQTFSIGLRALL